MDGDNNNDPDPLNVNVEEIKNRIIARFFLLDGLMTERLLPLIDELQPDQLYDPTTPELVLLREMEMDEVYILKSYLAACNFGLNRRQLHGLDSSDLVRRFRPVIDLIDYLLFISLTDIVRLEHKLGG